MCTFVIYDLGFTIPADIVWYDCDMVIGIDTSRAFGEGKTGTENYSYHLVKAILRLPESRAHKFVLFTRPNIVIPSELVRKNVIIREIEWKYLWTQAGLAWETWWGPRLDALWIPAHTLPALRRPGLLTVVTIHGLEYKWLPEYKNWLQRWYLPLSTFYAAKSANRLIAVSRFTKNQLEKEVHNISKKIKVVYEGVDASAQCHSDTVSLQKYDLLSKQYLLFVGTIQPRKNLPALIEAYSLVHKDFPEIKLVIAGSVGWMAEDVLRAPTRFGVQESVVFTGRIPDGTLSALYDGALVYAQPSVTEGFGLPILEAMAAGVPVVSSDGGALPEIVGSAGVIVNLKSQMTNSQIDDTFAERLAKALKMLITDKNLQNDLIAMGRKRVEEFGWDRAAKETLKVLTG